MILQALKNMYPKASEKVLRAVIKDLEKCRGKPRSDMPWIETEEDAEFIEFIKSYNEQQKPKALELLEKYGDKNIVIFKSRKEADAFLNGEIKQ